MNRMKFKYGFYAIAVLVSLLAVSCNSADDDGGIPGGMVPVDVQVSLDDADTKAFSNPGGHQVNRVLFLPFKKTDESLTDDDSNFVPVYSFAVQKDITGFPLTDVMLNMLSGSTHKVMVIGYNSSDFDFNNRSNPANRFDIGSAGPSVTLANFHLYPKSPVLVPEFFVCMATAYDGATPKGDAFKPESAYTVSGTLQRLVSGVSVKVTDVPSFVKSITLSAENLVKASFARNGVVSLYQTTGDGGTRIINKKSPDANGTVEFDQLLLPTFYDHRTGFFLDVELGSTTERYVVKVPDTSVSTNNKLILNPNEALNISGSYSTINLGFTLGFLINLDDDNWDGIQAI